MQQIKYAVHYSTITVTDAEFELVVALYKVGQKIPAIKFIRQQYQLSLKESKDICDAIEASRVGW